MKHALKYRIYKRDVARRQRFTQKLIDLVVLLCLALLTCVDWDKTLF